MMHIKRLKVLIALVVVVAAVAAGLILYRVLVAHEGNFTFYYPDLHMTRLVRESRQLPTLKDPRERFEVKLVREYCLGPLDYRTRWVLKENVALVSAYLVPDVDKTMILNFNKNFLDQLDGSIQTKSHEMEWFLKGLSETLKANTRVKRYFILVDNHMIYRSVADIRLDRAIRVVPLKKSTKPTNSGGK